MSYDLEEMLFLLLSLKHTTSSSFVTEHLSFSGVGALCSEAIREGFIIETRKELKITDKGLAFISETNNKLNRHGIERSMRVFLMFTLRSSLLMPFTCQKKYDNINVA